MFRFESISVFGAPLLSSEKKDKGMISDDITCTLSDEYIVDDSHFAPISEAIKRLSGGTVQFTGDEVAQCFDFASLKSVDAGFKVPFVRSAGYKDIAELSQYMMQVSADASESLKADLDRVKDEKGK